MAQNTQHGSTYPKDSDGYGLAKLPGGVIHTKKAAVVFGVTAETVLFTLPKGAVITDVKVRVTTAFNAGANNTLLLGLASDPDAFAAAAVVSSTGLVRYGSTTFVGTGIYADPLAADDAVIVTYNQTSTAADAGAAVVAVEYYVN
jgi:hypothetical protein